MNCLECNCETDNPKFCSRSCSATHNNRKYPKRQPEGTCDECGGTTNSFRKYCDECWNRDNTALKTKGEVYAEAEYQKSALIRQHSRRVYEKSEKPKECFICQYDFHVDVCHIKAISEFSDDSTLDEINDIDNLIALCRNHHWEFDHDGPAASILN